MCMLYIQQKLQTPLLFNYVVVFPRIVRRKHLISISLYVNRLDKKPIST